MGAIGSAIGAAGSIASSIFGGIKASKAMKKAKKMIQQEVKKNQDWYDRRYNEDATQRADAQRILTLTEENIKNRNRQAAGTQAVMGGTEESTAAAKAANNEALADATAQIAVNGEQRKDQIEQQYRQRDADLQGQLQQMEVKRGQAIADAAQAAGQSFQQMGSSLPF